MTQTPGPQTVQIRNMIIALGGPQYARAGSCCSPPAEALTGCLAEGWLHGTEYMQATAGRPHSWTFVGAESKTEKLPLALQWAPERPALTVGVQPFSPSLFSFGRLLSFKVRCHTKFP